MSLLNWIPYKCNVLSSGLYKQSCNWSLELHLLTIGNILTTNCAIYLSMYPPCLSGKSLQLENILTTNSATYLSLSLENSKIYPYKPCYCDSYLSPLSLWNNWLSLQTTVLHIM
jgi:hypothetical protein